MKKTVKLICLILAACLFSGIVTACNGNDNKGGTDNIIKIYLWNDIGKTPAGFDEVLSTFNNGAGKDLGFEVKFSFDTQSNYKEKLNFAMAAGKNDYDMVFDAGWIFLNDFAKKGYYHDLAQYFKPNSSYAGLKNNFSESFIENNMFSGGVYGVPITETFGEISVGYVRKDWRIICSNDTTWVKPANVGGTKTTADLKNGIDDFDELEVYLYWLKSNAGTHGIPNNVVPALSNRDATWGAWDIIDTRELKAFSPKDMANAGIMEDIRLSTDLGATAYIKNGLVMAASVDDEKLDAENGKSEYPQPHNTDDNAWQESYTVSRKWAEAGIISPDVLSETDSQAKFVSGMGGICVQTINNFGTVEAQLKNNVSDSELEIFVTDKALREKREGYARTDFKAWNFLCIPKSVSEAKKIQCVKFLNWIFESKDNHDLFQYGVKGKHWDEAKDNEGNYIADTIEYSGENPYNFPGYLLTWNPNYIRFPYASDPKVLEYSRYMYDSNRYVARLYPGFTFDHTRTEALKNALNNPDIATNAKAKQPYMLGQISDPVSAWSAELTRRRNDTALQSALTTIKNELIYQLQQYIDSL